MTRLFRARSALVNSGSASTCTALDCPINAAVPVTIVPKNARRLDLIVTFLALLELIRLKQVVAEQTELFGSIRLIRTEVQS